MVHGSAETGSHWTMGLSTRVAVTFWGNEQSHRIEGSEEFVFMLCNVTDVNVLCDVWNFGLQAPNIECCRVVSIGNEGWVNVRKAALCFAARKHYLHDNVAFQSVREAEPQFISRPRAPQSSRTQGTYGVIAEKLKEGWRSQFRGWRGRSVGQVADWTGAMFPWMAGESPRSKETTKNVCVLCTE
ncbi:hypothetical protein IF2G_03009 [Cordyceps javanica]|nr:hypothetical protein IF2G_03009 [Cordyceps javanica]